MSEPWDVIIAGAGAAGLMAAIRCGERGLRTLLLEKNKQAGVKILMSGGTRCNITHATTNRGIVDAYGKSGKFLYSPLAKLGVEETIALFEAEGVATKVEETGKVFPQSNKASDVLQALVGRLGRTNVIISYQEAIQSVSKENSSFRVVTNKRELQSKVVILTTGGLSYPGSGTTGDGLRIAATLGHTIVPTHPALVPITISDDWLRQLRGITLPDVQVSLFENAKLIAKKRGSLLFAHFGLSGPVILDLSRYVSQHESPNQLRLSIDLLPDLSREELDHWLQETAKKEGKKQLSTVVAAKVPRRLAEEMMNRLFHSTNGECQIAMLKKEQRRQLTSDLKELNANVTGTLGYKKAEVTSGGVSLSEVDSRDMQSKIVPGLYLAGEILDLDGPIGGFNFQAAWSTGWVAGSSVLLQATNPEVV